LWRATLELTSWTKAFKIYQYDLVKKQLFDTKIQPSRPYDNPESIEAVEVQAKSYDGTLVPLSITYRKGIKLDVLNHPIHRHPYAKDFATFSAVS
jgi:prolyl oligopeptidase